MCMLFYSFLLIFCRAFLSRPCHPSLPRSRSSGKRHHSKAPCGVGTGPMVRSCVLTLDKRVYASLSPGAMAYFHVDLPRGVGQGQSIYIRMEREGGDPVLMASSGQWPTVSLEAVEDMVRAHYCAFESFQADVALHDLVIPDAGRYRAPHALGEVDGFPAAAPDGAARWAIGVYNFDKVKAEACEIAVLASLDAGRAQVRSLNLTWTPTPGPEP